MNRLALTGICVLALAGIASSAAAADKILEFDTMVGVSAPFTGTANPIRGVNGGGRPWMLQSAKGELATDGKLEVAVTGLVLTETGANPIPSFRAIVSCLSKDAQNNVVETKVMTGTFPASTTGDAAIEAMVTLPSPCIAPIVFVTSPAGAWFAATGR